MVSKETRPLRLRLEVQESVCEATRGERARLEMVMKMKIMKLEITFFIFVCLSVCGFFFGSREGKSWDSQNKLV